MAASPALVRMSVEEYLNTDFQPDVDFVDGVIEERNLGEFDHARLQAAVLRLLEDHEDEWNVYVVPETRVQVATETYRVPDVCVTDARYEVEQIVRTPPLLCIEVVSPKDRVQALLRRAKDFHRMGVQVVWVFDPKTKRVWVSREDGASEWAGGVLSVLGTKIVFDPEEAFTWASRRR